MLGGYLAAYNSELGDAFKRNPYKEEAWIAIGAYKLAVRISIA